MRAIVSGLVAVGAAVVASLLAGAAAGGLRPATAWTALMCGSIVGIGAWCSMAATFRENPGTRPHGWIRWGVVTIFALFALRAFCWLIFLKDADIAFLSPNNLGDLSLHITYTTYLANGAPIWPENPIYAGSDLHYPFGVDLLNSLLAIAGVDLIRGLVWVGLLGALATGITLWRWGGAFAMAGFLFNGGLAGFAIFKTLHLEDFQDHYAWKSIPLALFITQRGLLYAIPAGLALLWSWRERFFRRAVHSGESASGSRANRGLPFWVETLLYATMPLFHLHTFLFLSAMLACWVISDFVSPAHRVHSSCNILRLIAAAFLPATLLIWFLTGGFHSSSLIYFQPGWLQGDTKGENPIHFWFFNFGFLPVAVVALFIWLWMRRNKPDLAAQTAEYAAFALPATGIFLIACFVMFAPWAWDNTKLMLWCYLSLLPSLWGMLRSFAPSVRTIACVALFFSGFVSLLGGIDSTHDGFALAGRKEIDSLRVPLRAFPVTSTFACVPTYNHPLLLLGHKVVAGYDGHLMSHGIDYLARFAELERLMNGEPGWQKRARKLGADFLFWGEREQTKYATSTTPWKGGAPVAARGTWGTIYDLRELK